MVEETHRGNQEMASEEVMILGPLLEQQPATATKRFRCGEYTTETQLLPVAAEPEVQVIPSGEEAAV